MTAWAFAVAPDGAGWVADVGAQERAALLDVVDDVVELLGGERTGPGAGDLPDLRVGAGPLAAPRDPALRRLLPDASRGVPDVAAEFRRLTEDELRATKVGQLGLLRAALAADGPAVVVAPGDAPAVAAAITDLRLVLAERLGVRTEADADAVYRLAAQGRPLDLADDDAVARRFLAIVSALLSVLQESLVERMLDGLPDDDEDDEDDGEDDGPDDPAPAP